MSALELFAVVILPVGLAAGGWLAAYLHKRSLQKIEPIETQMPDRDRSTTSIYVVAPRALPALLRQLSRNNQAQPRLH